MEGEAHCSVVAHVQCDDVWGRVGNFTSMGEWMGMACKVCLVENGPCGPNDIGAIRRVVLEDKEMMVRERLKAHYCSEYKKYYTYEMVMPADYDRYRAMFDFEFENITVTLSVHPVTSQRKTCVELYATYKVGSESHGAAVKQLLERYFHAQLDAIVLSTSQYDIEMSLPDVLTKFYAAPSFQPYVADLESLVAMWRDSVQAGHAANYRIAELERELKASRRTIDALTDQMRVQNTAPTTAGIPATGAPALDPLLFSGTFEPMEQAACPDAEYTAGPDGDEFKGLVGSPLYVSDTQVADRIRESYTPRHDAPRTPRRPDVPVPKALARKKGSSRGGAAEGYAAAAEALTPTPAKASPTGSLPPINAQRGVAADTVTPSPTCAAAGQPAVPPGDVQVEMLYPRIRGLSMQTQDIRAMFTKLDERGLGYLHPDAVAKFYLQIDIFEDEMSVQRILKKYVADGKVTFNAFHSLILTTIAQ
eukprot:TRINITY_DN32650_c0_g1_i1.p1 TRINITY_DN32650_c0_g1~~TRINITY_DN32650_c0_g1_i1.p1  ORF type:complete len:477 (+),score=121.17 TRINITY_DN32650_c0_g1_i1:64-1494(+)